MKKLTRIRLINWQYFTNDIIEFNGATLISGYNATGKTTILDAIQLVLTTNTKKFNLAANEKGRRELMGYVRCKLGAESQKYNRTGSVPANVALEFYDEEKDSYFILGVHMLSRSEDEHQVKTSWYCEEGRLEEFTFVNEDWTPVLEKEFLHKGKTVSYHSTKKDAEEAFKIRLGHLEYKFGEMIQKAIAFRPMDNVKQFINDFLLPESPVDIEGLKSNIQKMKELEAILEDCIASKEQLSKIRNKYEEYLRNEKQLESTRVLLILAEIRNIGEAINQLESKIRTGEVKITSLNNEITNLESEKNNLDNELIALKTERNTNKAGLVITEAENQIKALSDKISIEQQKSDKFDEQIINLKNYLNVLKTIADTPIKAEDYKTLCSYGNHDKKTEILEQIIQFNKAKIEEINSMFYELDSDVRNCDIKINELNAKKQDLELRKFTYPNDGIEKLKNRIAEEFKTRNIFSEVSVLCDLLEIIPEYKEWTNAVEGYLSSQKFYLVVEPKYYDVALEVYHKNNKTIHSVGIINTKKFNDDLDTEKNSLAEVVSTNNMYARRYVNYILNRVVRCLSINELEKYDIAITPDCMLYQGYVARNLNPNSYRNPFIGQNAYKVQLDNIIKELSELQEKREKLLSEKQAYDLVRKSHSQCKFDILSEYIFSPDYLCDFKSQLAKKQDAIEEAKKNTELLEIQFKIDETEKQTDSISKKINSKQIELTDIKAEIKNFHENLTKKDIEYKSKAEQLADNQKINFNAYQGALRKFEERIKKQTSSEIITNFKREEQKYYNYQTSYLDSLKDLQREFIIKSGCDYSEGVNGIDEYIKKEQELEKVVIATNKETLEKTKKQFYEIFRADFLFKMQELIKEAKDSFTQLNKVLNTLSYGEDKYEFKITYNKAKENFYKMIMSENNITGGEYNLWANNFDSEYKEELEDLQAKLLTSDNADDKVVKEYTDYRTYLDFDILIKKITKDNNGETKILTMKFSDISGEKSGGETQIPFYVAIAASFYQLYSYGNTTRLILLDEAFEKMDEIRITTMMNFLKLLNLQVILVTPPDKIDIIKDNVDSVIVVNRKNNRSIATGLQY